MPSSLSVVIVRAATEMSMSPLIRSPTTPVHVPFSSLKVIILLNIFFVERPLSQEHILSRMLDINYYSPVTIYITGCWNYFVVKIKWGVCCKLFQKIYTITLHFLKFYIVSGNLYTFIAMLNKVLMINIKIIYEKRLTTRPRLTSL